MDVWYTLSLRLGIPVDELMRRISSSQFVMYKAKLDNEVNEFHREDYYFAQLTAWILRLMIMQGGGRATRVKESDFIIPFVRETKKPKKELTHEEKIKWHSDRSRAFWFAVVAGPQQPKKVEIQEPKRLEN